MSAAPSRRSGRASRTRSARRRSPTRATTRTEPRPDHLLRAGKRLPLRGAPVPNKRPGVYEARRREADERLTIGKAKDLRHRVKQGLIRGEAPHPSGAAIRAKEDLARVEVRWAITERPAAVEEELHQRHRV